MTRRDPLLGLRHMLDAAREAVDAATGLTVADLEADRLRELALERLLEIPEIVLRTIRENLPPLVRQIEAALSEGDGTT